MEDDDKVGYCRPPKHTRWKKGQSGNPGGRKAQSKNLDTLMLQELEEKIALTEGGREKRITKRQAIAKRIINGALKGNIRLLEFLFKYMRELGVADPFGMTTDDKAELSRALQALAAKQGSSEEVADDAGR